MWNVDSKKKREEVGLFKKKTCNFFNALPAKSATFDKSSSSSLVKYVNLSLELCTFLFIACMTAIVSPV